MKKTNEKLRLHGWGNLRKLSQLSFFFFYSLEKHIGCEIAHYKMFNNSTSSYCKRAVCTVVLPLHFPYLPLLGPLMDQLASQPN